MKKLAIMALCIAAAISANAQADVLKNAERAQKEGKTVDEIVTIITPALTHPETAQLAQTWVIPGKAAYKQYDDYLGLKQFGKLSDAQARSMGSLLIQGYEFYMKALPLDSMPDAKGKIKPKHSKNIISTIAGHHNDYSNVAAEAWGYRDWETTYKAFGIYNEIATNPVFAKLISTNDTIIGEVYFNQALAAWQMNEYELSLASFDKAYAKGYNKKQLFDYAMAVAQNAKNPEAVLRYAEAAMPLYGKEDPNYMGNIVNYYLQNKDFDKAFSIINEAIVAEPNNDQYFVILGVLHENNENPTEALNAYKKASEINPENAQALYNYGRQICEQAYTLSDSAPTNQAEYTEFFLSKIKPLFEQASKILEQAYTINDNYNQTEEGLNNPRDNADILRYLENVYYNLNDEAKLSDVKRRKALN